jgi:hypothetical protein
MAGIQAIIDQITKSHQGQADYFYYPIATQWPNAFHDITVGGNQVPCVTGSPDCVTGVSGPSTGFNAESGYPATTGYDQASGLGTVDVANLIHWWPFLTIKPTTTTLSITPVTIAHGTTVKADATVAPKSGAGTPTGSVGLNSNDPVAYANALDVLSLTGGAVTASLDNLPGGIYQVSAVYSGDGTFAPSVSAPVTVTVTAEKDTLNAISWVLNPLDDNLYPLTPGMSIPYGSQVFVAVQPVGVNEATSKLGDKAPATGAVVFKDAVGASSTTTSAPLNSVGLAEWDSQSLIVGNNVVSATYAGDASYLASSNASAAKFTVFKGTTTIYIKPVEPSQQVNNGLTPGYTAGSNVTVDVEMYSDYLGFQGAIPTGTLTVTLGGQTQTVTAPFKYWGPSSQPVVEAIVTFPKVPAGLLPLSATYSGDANWNGTSSLWGSINTLGAKPAPTVTLTAATTTYSPTGTVTMVGTVTGKAGGPRPAGYLYFTWLIGDYYYYYTLEPKAGTTNASTVTLTFPANELYPGANLFVATFEGDSNYAWQSSAPLTITLDGGDFSLITTTQSVKVKPGATGTGSVTIAPVNFYTGAVTVSCAGPAGITCTPATTGPTVGKGVTDAITIKAATTAAAGTYPAVVTATGQGHIHTAEILVAVP